MWTPRSELASAGSHRMAVYKSASQLVPGDANALRQAAEAYAVLSRGTAHAAAATSRLIDASVGIWSGAAADGFRASGTAQFMRLRAVTPLADDAHLAYSTLATRVEDLRNAADGVLQRSQHLGLPYGALTSDPRAVTSFLAHRPERGAEVASLLSEVVRIRLELDAAHNVFMVALGGLVSVLAADRRSPDERRGRRIRVDELTRRSDPGDGHSSNDWAGRAILERYLRGGGDWVIDDDPNWSEYMMANERLRSDMADRAEELGQEALSQHQSRGSSTGTFDNTFAQAIENGEGIVGYQYLHGTNAEVGGFQHVGNTRVTPRGDGNYRVVIDSSYTWNDVIDPNPKYSTDRWKSRLAEIITLGQADAYDIRITWSAETELIVDPHGNMLSMTGYPG